MESRVHFHTLTVLLTSLGLFAGCETWDHPIEIEHREAPLIGGDHALNDPAVVALTRGGTSSFCSGTLVSPRVVLTAAHCIDMLGVDPNAAVYFGDDTKAGGAQITVGAKKQHPMWNGNAASGRDIGMLLLDFPYEDPSIAKNMNTNSPAENHLQEDYRHVGFGVFDRETGSADGKKREGTVKLRSLGGDTLVSGTVEISTCFGDSGGPGFLTIDGEEVVAGIHSTTTSEQCFPDNRDTNVQLYANDFVLPWIQENDFSCRLDGVCGRIGCENDPDCVPCGPDGTCVSDCELPDPDCQTQEIGEICRGEGHCKSELCVGFRGDPDYRFCSESCTPGNDNCPSGMSCQEILPIGNICYYDKDPPGALGDRCDSGADCGSYQCSADGHCVTPCKVTIGIRCPDDFDCETREGDQGDFFCYPIPVEDGGCGCQSSSTGGASSVLLIALAGLFLRRKKPRARR